VHTCLSPPQHYRNRTKTTDEQEEDSLKMEAERMTMTVTVTPSSSCVIVVVRYVFFPLFLLILPSNQFFFFLVSYLGFFACDHTPATYTGHSNTHIAVFHHHNTTEAERMTMTMTMSSSSCVVVAARYVFFSLFLLILPSNRFLFLSCFVSRFFCLTTPQPRTPATATPTSPSFTTTTLSQPDEDNR
jgi:hypothetical protein